MALPQRGFKIKGPGTTEEAKVRDFHLPNEKKPRLQNGSNIEKPVNLDVKDSNVKLGKQIENLTKNIASGAQTNINRNRGNNSYGGNRNRNRPGRNVPASGGGANSGNFRSDDFFIANRLRALSGPTIDLPQHEITEEIKFSARNRLYVGNLTPDATEDELKEMFKPFGEVAELFLNHEKNFAFLKVDYQVNSEKAKRALDGTMRKGRQLRVRFASNAAVVRVKNLTPYVSNELLYKAFEVFGPIEKAKVIVDDRGKHTGEGIVVFEKKSTASACIRLCTEKCFFLTSSLRPCIVEPFDANEDPDGLPESYFNKKSQDFCNERNIGPRFAEPNSFEYAYGTKWKQLHDLYRTKFDSLKRELKQEEEKLEVQMEYVRYEHETELLRQELRKRESDNERKKLEWERKEKLVEDARKRDEEIMRRQQNDMQVAMMHQEDDLRRRQQENTLFIQAQQLTSLLDGGNVGFDQYSGSNASFGGYKGNEDNFNQGNMKKENFPSGSSTPQGGNQRGGQSGMWDRRNAF